MIVLQVVIDNVKRNNVAKARMALSLGVDINCVTEDGKWSGLTVAAANNALEVVTWLLGLPGLDVNIRTEGDWVLWDEKDKWNERDKGFIRKWTALMFACVKGHHRIVKILVSAPNIDLNIKSFRNLSEKTAAHFAASTSQKFDNYKCLEILTETTGVDWNLKDIFGRIPLVQTIIDGEARRFNRIFNISGIDFNAVDNNGWTPLYWALKESRKEFVTKLLAKPGIDLKVRTNIGDSLAVAAVEARAANEPLAKFSQLQGRPLLGPSPG